MNRMQRTSPLAILAFAAIGIAVGLLVQLARSAGGSPPLVPPVSLAATLLVIAVVLIVLAILLRRAVRSGSDEEHRGGPRRPVNPFHAVRLLAGARAGQFAGALFAGFAGGSALQLLTRTVPPPGSTWVPMLLVLIGGIVLAVCGILAELLCRVPPHEPEPEPGQDDAHGAGFAP